MSAIDSEEMGSGADSDHIHTRSADKQDKKRKGPSAGALLGLVRSNMFKNTKNVKSSKKEKGSEEKKQVGRGGKTSTIGNSPVVPGAAKDEESAGGSQSVTTSTPTPCSTVKSSTSIPRGPRLTASGLSSPAITVSSADVEIPFKLGWRREMVHRTPGEGRSVIDIYYFSPEGRKFRSHPQIVEHLERSGSTLSASSFSFSKHTLYHEPMETERYASLIKGRKLINGEVVPSTHTSKKRKMAADEDGGTAGSKRQKLEDGSKKISKPKPVDFVKSDLEELQRELNRTSTELEKVVKTESVVTKAESTVLKPTITKPVAEPTSVITEETSGRTRHCSARRMSGASQEVTPVKSARAGRGRMKREMSSEIVKPVVNAQEKIQETGRSGVGKLTVGTDQEKVKDAEKEQVKEKKAAGKTNVKVTKTEAPQVIDYKDTVLDVANAQPAHVEAVSAQPAHVASVSGQPAQVAAVNAQPAQVGGVLDKREMVRAAASQTLKLFMSRALRGTTTAVPAAATPVPSNVPVTATATAATPVPSDVPVAAAATTTAAASVPSAPVVAAIATPTTSVEGTSDAAVPVPSAGSVGDLPKPAKRLRKGWVIETVFVPDVKVESEEVKPVSLERETRHRRASKIFTPDDDTKTPTTTKKSRAKPAVVRTLSKSSAVISDGEKLSVAANEEITTVAVARKPKTPKYLAVSPATKSSTPEVLDTTLHSETSELTSSVCGLSSSRTECSEDVKFNDSLSNIVTEDSKFNDSLSSVVTTPASGKAVKTTGKSLKRASTSQPLSETGISSKVRVMKTAKKSAGKMTPSVTSSSASSLIDSSPVSGEKNDERAKFAKILNKKTGSGTVISPASGKSLLKDAPSSAVNVTPSGVKISPKGSVKESSVVGSRSVTKDIMIVGADGSCHDKSFVSMQDCGINVIHHPVGLMSRRKPCGLDCPGRLSIPPSLYCQVCMVAFHPECVGFKYLSFKGNFTCWECKLASRESSQRSYSLNSYVSPATEKSTQPSPAKTPIVVVKKKPADGIALKPASVTAVTIKSAEKLAAKDKSKTKDKTVTLKSATASATVNVNVAAVKSKSSTAAVKIELNKNVSSTSKLPKNKTSVDALKESKIPKQIENETNGSATNTKLVISGPGEINEKKKKKKKKKKVVPCPSEQLQSGEAILLPSALLDQIDKTLPCDICIGVKAIRVGLKKFQKTPAGYRIVLPSGSLPESYLLGHRVPLQFTVSTSVKDNEAFTNITVTVFGEH